MNNATCHSELLSDRYSNIKVVYLPKNTTSRLETLDAGIIRNFKLKYRKKLLKFVIPRINSDVKTTKIIQEVVVLKAISWIKSTWDDVTKDQLVIIAENVAFGRVNLMIN